MTLNCEEISEEMSPNCEEMSPNCKEMSENFEEMSPNCEIMSVNEIKISWPLDQCVSLWDGRNFSVITMV